MSETQKHTKPNVPNLRFPGFEGEWKTVSLGDLFEIGSSKRIFESQWRNTGIPFYRTREIVSLINGTPFSSPIFIDENLFKDFIRKYGDIQAGDMLVTGVGTIGQMYVVPETNKFYFKDGNVIWFKHNPSISSYFIKHLFSTKTIVSQLQNNASITTVATYTIEGAKKTKAIIPSKSEQDKIASFLNLLDERISIQSKVIERYESLIKALRHHIFASINPVEEACFSDILSYEQPTRYIVTDTEYSDNKDLTPVLTANKAFILGYTDEREGIYWKGPCIILDDFTLDCKIVDFQFKVKSSAIKILTAKSSVNLRYVYEYLRYLDLNTEEHKRHYIAEIEPMSIALPGKAEIDAIANLFSKLDSCKQLAERDLELLKSEKAFYLNSLFI